MIIITIKNQYLKETENEKKKEREEPLIEAKGSEEIVVVFVWLIH